MIKDDIGGIRWIKVEYISESMEKMLGFTHDEIMEIIGLEADCSRLIYDIKMSDNNSKGVRSTSMRL